MDDIAVVDFDGSLKEEIRILRAQLILLLQEKEELLYHICPELMARYAREVGSYENRAHYQEYMILELKRRIEIARAALNREQTISKEKVDKQIETEYKAFYEKVEQERRRTEQAQKEQDRKERRKREAEQRWQAKYGSARQDPEENRAEATGWRYIGGDEENSSGTGRGEEADSAEKDGNIGKETDKESRKKASDNTDGSEDGEKKRPSLKDLYRKIIKRLHPDVNPDATEREQELFRRATQAYEDGDIETLQEIYDEVFSSAEPESEPTDNLSPEELLEIKRRLEGQIRALQAELNEIKSRNPYRYKELLDNPEKLSLVQAALQKAIRLYEGEIKRLNAELEKINREMDELKQRKR